MLNTLLESRQARVRNRLGAATSMVVHISVIVSALYVTNARPLPAIVPETSTRIHIRPAAPEVAPSNARRRTSEGERAGRRPPRALILDLSIATEIPAIDLTPGIGTLSDFPERSGISGESTTSADAVETGSREAYDGVEVDIPASALGGGPVPEYPASLRAAGVEGTVVAQFVVDSRGNAIAGSIRIVSSSNGLFSESVRTAIPAMRFVPARLRGKPVHQTVRQLFVFKLSR
jgi:periplasmic protein TonB